MRPLTMSISYDLNEAIYEQISAKPPYTATEKLKHSEQSSNSRAQRANE